MIAIQSGRDAYLQTLPDRPYCTDQLGKRLLIRNRERAVQFDHVQHNHPLIWRWLMFDIDGEDAYFRAEERGFPAPNFIALNPANGHGHAGYLLETPVSAFENSSRCALRFCEDVVRGMTNKLGADRGYSGFLSKSPFSPHWETAWPAFAPYRLDRLNDCLDPSDKRSPHTREPSFIGRNVTTFDAVRKVAYREWIRFKRGGNSLGQFEARLREVADETNSTFGARLSSTELKGIVRSVARWVWDRFSIEGLSEIQATRAHKRWATAPTLTSLQPWRDECISRRTWERRRAKRDHTLLS